MRNTVASLLAIGFGLFIAYRAVVGEDEQKEPEKKIEPEAVKLGRPVDFERDILPILEENCIACHNLAIAESKLNLEEISDILKGGKRGAAVVPKDPEKSLLYQAAARAKKPAMPPLPNKVEARALTPKELGLLRQWILEGASGGSGSAKDMVQWHPLPSGIKAIYSVAMSPWARFVAAGRANQIVIYEIGAGQEVARLVDPNLTSIEFDGKPMYPDRAAHRDFVHSLAFSPDGTMLASGGYRVVKLWKRPQNARKFEFVTSNSVSAIAVSADAQWVAVGASDNSIKLWNLNDGKPGKTYSGHTALVSGLSFSADGSKLVSSSQDKTARIWNTADGQLVGQIKAPAPINAVTFNKDATRIVTGHSDNLIRVWDTASATATGTKQAEGDKTEPIKPVLEIKGHSKPVSSVALILPNGNQLVSGSQDATVRIWDLNKGRQIRSMKHGGPVSAVAVRPDGQAIASASSNNTAKLWDMNGRQLAEMKGDFAAQRQVLAMSDAQTVAKQKVGLAEAAVKEAEKNNKDRTDGVKKAKEANTNADKALAEADKKAKDAEKKVADAVKALAVATQAQKKATTGRDAAIKQAAADAEVSKKAIAAKVEAAKLNTQAAANAKKVAAEKAKADKLAIQTAAAAKAADNKLNEAKQALDKDKENKSLADAFKAAQETAAKAAQASRQGGLAKAAAEKKLADSQTAAKKAADAFNAAEKARQDADAKNKASVQAKSKAEAAVKTAESNTKKAADAKAAADKAAAPLLAALKKAQNVKKSSERSLQLSDKALKTAQVRLAQKKSEKAEREKAETKVDDAVANAKKAVSEKEKPIRSIAFSLDGTKLVTGGDDNTVHVWDAKNGIALETFVGQTGPIAAIAFAQNNLIVSGSADKTVSVWNANPSWSLVGQLGVGNDSPIDISSSPFVNRVLALDFSPDGKLLAVGGGDPSRSGELTIWDVEKKSLVREIKDAHSDTVFGIEFSWDGIYLASGAADKFVKMFEVASGKHLKSFEGHTHHVLDVSWKADGSSIASAGADNAIKVWNVETGEQRRTIAGYSKQVTSLTYIGVGDNIVSCSGDRNVRFHTASNGRNYRSFSGGTDFMYSAVASRDESLVVAAGQDGVLRVWNGKNSKVIRNFEPPKPPEGNKQVNANTRAKK